MYTSRHRTTVLLVALTLVGALAACGDDDDSSSTTAATPATADSTSVTEASTAGSSGATTAATGEAPSGDSSAPNPAGATTLIIADSSLGPILTDAEGMTVYVFTPDDAGPSTCTDQCLANWPAVPAPASAGDGVDADLLGESTRPDDGSSQATYNGWPVYHFGGDTAPGDVNGQGLNGKWYVIDASGNAVDTD